MGSLRYTAAVLVAVLLLVGCSSAGAGPDQTDAGGEGDAETTATEAGNGQGVEPGDDTDDSPSPRTTRVPALEPTPAEDLDISVDPQGRPYEVGFDPERSSIDRRFATVLETGDRILLIGGEGLYGDPAPARRVADELRLPDAEKLRLTVLWEVGSAETTDDDPSDDDRTDELAADERLAGIRLDRAGSTVAEWREREVAFVGLSGYGVVTVADVIDRAAAAYEAEENPLIDPPTEDDPLLIADLDERPGRETLVLDLAAAPAAVGPTAGGDPTRYLVAVGFDVDGVAASVVIAADSLPWRVVVPDGTPPPDVIEREDQLIDCIEGRRLIDKWGHCI